MSLIDLPVELLLIVIKLLDPKGIVACKATCRKVHSAISTSLELEYNLTLFAYGLRDNARSLKIVSEKLERLRIFHRRHREIRFIPHFSLRVDDSQRLDFPCSPLVFTDLDLEVPNAQLFIQYSGSHIRDVKDRHWTIAPPGPLPVFAYTYNMGEDLLILQTSDVPRARFFLLAVSTGEWHPKAKLPFLEGPTIALDHTTYGPYLLIHGKSSIHYLWNWQTGQMLTKIRCYYYSAAFLDLDHLAFVHMSEEFETSIHVYRLPCVILIHEAAPMNAPDYVFGLPALAAQSVPVNCSLRRGNSFPHAPGGGTGDFYTDPEETLLTVEIAQLNPELQYELMIHLRALLNLFTPSHHGQYTSWHEWGPLRAHATPLLRHPPVVGWRSFSTFGMRRVGMYPSAREDGTLVAMIYDYHPRRVALARREPSDADDRWAVVEGETVPGSWIGTTSGLKSYLPYILTVVPLPEELQQYQGTMITLGINDDGIVACADFVATRPKMVHLYTI